MFLFKGISLTLGLGNGINKLRHVDLDILEGVAGANINHKRLGNLNEGNVSRARIQLISPLSRSDNTSTVPRLNLRVLRRIASSIVNVALELRSGTELVLGIIHNVAPGDEKIRTDKPSGTNLPDIEAGLFVLKRDSILTMSAMVSQAAAVAQSLVYLQRLMPGA